MFSLLHIDRCHKSLLTCAEMSAPPDEISYANRIASWVVRLQFLRKHSDTVTLEDKTRRAHEFSDFVDSITRKMAADMTDETSSSAQSDLIKAKALVLQLKSNSTYLFVKPEHTRRIVDETSKLLGSAISALRGKVHLKRPHAASYVDEEARKRQAVETNDLVRQMSAQSIKPRQVRVYEMISDDDDEPKPSRKPAAAPAVRKPVDSSQSSSDDDSSASEDDVNPLYEAAPKRIAWGAAAASAASSSSSSVAASAASSPSPLSDEWKIRFTEKDFERKSDAMTANPEQEVNIVKGIGALSRYHRYSDESNMGAGKTVTTCEMSHRLKKPMLIIGMAGTMATKWKAIAKRQGAGVVGYITWAGLRGSKEPTKLDTDMPLSHPWLVRRKSVLGTKTIKATGEVKNMYLHSYHPTAQLISLIQSGVMVVADEAQSAKNESLQSKAFSAITHAIYGDVGKEATLSNATVGNSCILTLSATLMDKQEHSERMLQLFGLLPPEINIKNQMWTVSNKQGFNTVYIPTDPMNRFIELCMRLDDKKVDFYHKNILQYDPYTTRVFRVRSTGLLTDKKPTEAQLLSGEIETFQVAKKADQPVWFIFFLYVDIIRPKIAGATAVNKRGDGVSRTYYNLRAKFGAHEVGTDGKSLKDAMNELLSEMNQIQEALKTHLDADLSSGLKTRLKDIEQEIETVKSRLFVRLAKDRLKANPRAKVLIFLNLLKNVEAVSSMLKRYGVGKIIGETKKKDRQKLQDRFQAPLEGDPDIDLRVLVGTITAMSVGIDLHDTTGTHPRTTLISPNHFFASIHQATGRIDRVGVKGSVEQIIVFVNNEDLEDHNDHGLDEQTLMAKNHEKSLILRSTASQQEQDGVTFLDDFDTFQENADGSVSKVEMARFITKEKPLPRQDARPAADGDNEWMAEADISRNGGAAAAAASSSSYASSFFSAAIDRMRAGNAARAAERAAERNNATRFSLQ